MPIYKQTETGPWWASISVPGKPRTRISLKTRDREEAEARYLILERAAWAEAVVPRVASPATTELIKGRR